MSEQKQRMIEKALGVHKKIFPCKGKSRIDECFTIEGQKMIFWFNTEDENTHIIFEKIFETEKN